MRFPYFTLFTNECTCRRCTGGRRWCAITTVAPDEAGRQGLFLSHRPLVGFGNELLGGLGTLEPGIVQLEVSSSLAICPPVALLWHIRWPVPPPVPGSWSAGAPGCLRRSLRRAIRGRRRLRQQPERHGCWSARSLVGYLVGGVVGSCASLIPKPSRWAGSASPHAVGSAVRPRR